MFWKRWGGFGTLLAVGASRWLLENARPESASSAASGALGFLWAALLVGVLSSTRKNGAAGWRIDSRTLLGGAMLFAGPAAAMLLQAKFAEATSLTIALALTPVAIAIAGAALGSRSDAGLTGKLWPGLAAVAGLLLLLPQPALGDVRTDLALVLTPLLTGTGAVLLAESKGDGRVKMTWALAVGAAVLAVGWIQVIHRDGMVWPSLLAVACDGLTALLSLLVLLQMGAERWSAQFALLPLLVLGEGLALLRPGWSARWLSGLLLLAVASVFLLMPEPAEAAAAPLLTP